MRFHEAFPDGVDLGDRCEEGHGMFCNAADLEPEGTAGSGNEVQANIDQLFDAVEQVAAEQPLLVFIKVRTGLTRPPWT